jgi:glutathionyl-hydroquinone reductase
MTRSPSPPQLTGHVFLSSGSPDFPRGKSPSPGHPSFQSVNFLSCCVHRLYSTMRIEIPVINDEEALAESVENEVADIITELNLSPFSEQ